MLAHYTALIGRSITGVGLVLNILASISLYQNSGQFVKSYRAYKSGDPLFDHLDSEKLSKENEEKNRAPLLCLMLGFVLQFVGLWIG